MPQHRDTVVGLFGERERALDAITVLKDAGFAPEDINLLMPDRGAAEDLAAETGTRAGGGAATGAVAGGLLGGLGGWLVGAGALAIPGLGPFIAAGALASALGGAVLGAGMGAIAGALVDMGISEDEARYYEQEVRGGQTLVAVRVERHWLREAERILRTFGARAVTRSGRSSSDDGGGPVDDEPLQRSASDRSELTRPVVGSTATSQGDWADRVPRYRAAWQRSSAVTWGEVEPYYRYLHDKRHRPEYRAAMAASTIEPWPTARLVPLGWWGCISFRRGRGRPAPPVPTGAGADAFGVGQTPGATGRRGAAWAM